MIQVNKDSDPLVWAKCCKHPVKLLSKRRLYVLLLCGNLTVIGTTAVILSPRLAVKGIYSTVGLLIVGTVLLFSPDDTTSDEFEVLQAGRVSKLITVLSLLSISAVLLLPVSQSVVLVFNVLAVVLLVTQLRKGQSPASLPFGVITVIVTNLLIKYLSVGFYYGSGDVFFEYQRTQSLLRANDISGIPGDYTFFPLMYILGGTTDLVTDLPLYDTIMAVQIFIYLVPILLLLALSNNLLAHRPYSNYVVFAILLVPVFVIGGLRYNTQYFASVLFLQVLYTVLSRRRAVYVRFDAVSMVLLLALVFAHHLTFVLIIPVVGIILVLKFYRGAFPKHPNYQGVQISVLTVGILGAIGYWIFRGSTFIQQAVLVGWTQLAAGFKFAFGRGQGSSEFLYYLGGSPPTMTLQKVVLEYYHSIGRIHMTLFFAIVILGVLQFSEVLERDRYSREITVLVLSFVGVVFILNTPFTFKIANRYQFLLGLLAPVSVGLGLYAFHRRMTSKGMVSTLGILLIVVAGTTNAAVASEIFIGEEGPERFYTEQEYDELHFASHYVLNYGDSASSFWTERTLVNSIFEAQVQDLPLVTQERIHIPYGLFIYLETWPDHTQTVSRPSITDAQSDARNPYTEKAQLTDHYIQSFAGSHNRVYDSGKIGILWEASKS